jgi:hypothetical protein
MSNETRQCQNCKKDFVIETEDFNFYEKIKVPAPTFCPLCRAERRFVFRNERKLFKVKDFYTNKDIFSLYPNRDSKKNLKRDILPTAQRLSTVRNVISKKCINFSFSLP